MKILGTLDIYAKKIANIVPESSLAIVSRLAIFMVFWKSVQTKIVGLTVFDQHFAFWNLTGSTVMLFEYEYDLPLLPPNLAAYLATFGEFFLSIAILLGFMTRLSALGLFLNDGGDSIFVYPEAWTVHILWAALLLYLVKHGGGDISIDKVLRQA